MNTDLSERKAIVCGSTQGMGRAAAEELAILGATVTLVARNEDSLKTVRDALRGGDHQAVCVDFGETDILEKRVNSHVERDGPFHILVNNTGGPPPGEIADAESEEFLDAFSKHLLSQSIDRLPVLQNMLFVVTEPVRVGAVEVAGTECRRLLGRRREEGRSRQQDRKKSFHL